MNYSRLFSVECPQCRAAIPFLRVKRRFACKACTAPLMSNRSSVDVWAVLIYVAAAPVVWFLIDGIPQTSKTPGAAWMALSVILAVAFYTLLVPRALRVEQDNWSDQEAATPGEIKTRKVLHVGGNAASQEGARRSL